MAIIRQEIQINGQLETCSTANVTSAGIVLLDTTKYANATYYFEIVAKTSVSVERTVSLRRNGTSTDDATITIPLLTTAYTRLRSTSFTPPAGTTEYVVFLTGAVTGTVTAGSCRIVIIQNSASISATETQICLTALDLTTSTVTTVVDDPLYFYFDSSKWDGTITAYFEAALLTPSSKSAVTCDLEVDDGAFGGWTQVVQISSTGTASAPYTRVRSAAITLTNNRNYRVATKSPTSKSDSKVQTARIILQQAGNITKIEPQYAMFGFLWSGTAFKDDWLQLWDENEWDTTSESFFHEAYGVAAGTSDVKLQDPSGPTDVTGSSITDVIERERTTALTMPTTGHNFSAIATTNVAGQLHGSKVIAQVTIPAATTFLKDPILSGGVIPWKR